MNDFTKTFLIGSAVALWGILLFGSTEKSSDVAKYLSLVIRSMFL